MSDLVHLTRGHFPWHPSEGSRVVATFDEYEIPLEGVIEQDGSLYLFDCILGRMTRPGVWIYSHISDDELQQLDAAEGEAFDRLVAQIRVSRPAKFAVSMREFGIVAEADAVDPQVDTEEAVSHLTERLRDRLEEFVQSQQDLNEMVESKSLDPLARGLLVG